jgi:methionine-rich copper-binding protein CopC
MSAIHRWPRRLAAVIGGAILAVMLIQSAFAHAMPIRVSPGQDAVLTKAPTEIAVDTGERMSAKAGDNDLVVRDSKGASVTTAHAVVDGTAMHMSLALPSTLAAGTYTVQWFTLSADDGEDASGTWSFTYDPTGTASAGTQPAAGVGTGGIDAKIAFAQPAAGASITGDSVALALDLTHITLVPMGSSGDVPNGNLGGHIHIMVDGTGIGMAMSASGLKVSNLSNGTHTIMADLAAPNHVPYDPPITAMVKVTVSGSTASGSPMLTFSEAMPMPATGAAATMATPTAPKTGSAGLAATRQAGSTAIVLLVLTAVVVLGARFVAHRVHVTNR